VRGDRDVALGDEVAPVGAELAVALADLRRHERHAELRVDLGLVAEQLVGAARAQLLDMLRRAGRADQRPAEPRRWREVDLALHAIGEPRADLLLAVLHAG